MTNNETKKTTIAILAISLIAAVAYGFFSYKQQAEKTKEVAIEKDSILDSKNEILALLSTLETDYDDGLLINTELSSDLEIKKNEIVKLKKSLKNFNGVDNNTLSYFKNKIEELNRTSSALLKMNDSLIRQIEVLNEENGELRDKLGNQKSFIGLLTEQNKVLFTRNFELAKNNSDENEIANENDEGIERKVIKDPYRRERMTKRDVIEKQKSLAEIKIKSLNERKGFYKETSRARAIDAFEISFKINNDNIVKKGESIKLYFTIKDANGSVLNLIDSFIDENKNKILYSKSTDIKYNANTLSNKTIIKLDKKRLKKGKYDIYIYLDKVLIRKVSKILS